jgi:hypothetical protein
METKLNEDWLDRTLHAEREAIPDDGFSRRVVASLPAAPDTQWVHNSIIFLATIISSIIALFILPAGHWLGTFFNSLPVTGVSPMLVAAIATGFVITASASLVFFDRDTVLQA